MAIVRELITLLGTEVDPAGFQQYETGLKRIKELALGLAGTLGLVFSADKIIEFADGLIDAGKEVNRLIAQLKVMARPLDDVNQAQQQIFEGSQQLGLSYKDVLNTYRNLFVVMSDGKASQDEIVTSTENIYKALRVGRASAEQMTSAMEIMQRGFARGAFRSMTIGRLKDEAPIIVKMMQDFYKTDEAGLRAIAKSGKITAEEMVKIFGSANAELDKQFALVPQKLGNVFNRIYNDLVNVTAQIYKLTEASEFMGKIVWYVWSRLTFAVKTLSDAVGGLKNLVQLLGIALMVALGPYLIRTLALATAWTIRWAVANAALLIQWLAIGAAIAAVALGIQDLVFWIQGKESIIGTWVGPFDKLAENFKKLDIFAPLRAISDLFKGDFSGFLKEIDKIGHSTEALIATAGLAAGAFMAWNVLKFTGIISAIGEIIKAIRGIPPETKKVEEALDAVGAKKKTTEAIKAPGETTPGAVAKPGEPLPGPRNPAAAGIGYALNILDPLNRMLEDRRRAEAGLPPAPKPLDVMMQTDTGKKAESIYQDIRNRARATIGLGPDYPPGYVPPVPPVPTAPTPGAVPAVPSVTVTQGVKNWLNDTFGYLLPGMGKLGEAMKPETKPITFADWDTRPRVGPGAMGPTAAGPTTTNVQPTFNQSNNIHVETTLDADQIGRIIGDKVGQLAGERIDAFSRSLTVGAPRVEAATQ